MYVFTVPNIDNKLLTMIIVPSTGEHALYLYAISFLVNGLFYVENVQLKFADGCGWIATEAMDKENFFNNCTE